MVVSGKSKCESFSFYLDCESFLIDLNDII